MLLIARQLCDALLDEEVERGLTHSQLLAAVDEELREAASARVDVFVELGLLQTYTPKSHQVRYTLNMAGYIGLMVAYSYGLKRVVILDVFAIAAGFVLRAAGGAVAIDVPISPWLYVCTMLLALFIGFGKRRHELTSLHDAAALHRANLSAYSLPLLDQMISVIASATVMAYSFYTFDAASVPRNHAMMLTIPFVAYAIFRYLYLIHHDDRTGSPETLLFADAPLFICIASWGVTSVVILYLTA
jgi:4-hydroxybenzoate polyprenyltransferase